MSDSDHRRTPRRRRSDGERSRSAILREAARLATVEGLDGLSIARLADAVGMSKSGLFAHFGSKEELQLATIETAAALFAEEVVEPATAAANGLERIRRLADNYLRHIETAYPGGCFFASLYVEMDTHPGPVGDVAVRFMSDWLHLLETAVRDGQAEGVIDPAADVGQLVFEVEAQLFLANALYVPGHDPTPLDRARRAIAARLEAAATDQARTPSSSSESRSSAASR
jgi:AcrR family transcriptional regulator